MRNNAPASAMPRKSTMRMILLSGNVNYNGEYAAHFAIKMSDLIKHIRHYARNG
jgi:NADH:ubiquinone oxidoreductase subunit F (NADH-binding)